MFLNASRGCVDAAGVYFQRDEDEPLSDDDEQALLSSQLRREWNAAVYEC